MLSVLNLHFIGNAKRDSFNQGCNYGNPKHVPLLCQRESKRMKVILAQVTIEC